MDWGRVRVKETGFPNDRNVSGAAQFCVNCCRFVNTVNHTCFTVVSCPSIQTQTLIRGHVVHTNPSIQAGGGTAGILEDLAGRPGPAADTHTDVGKHVWVFRAQATVQARVAGTCQSFCPRKELM